MLRGIIFHTQIPLFRGGIDILSMKMTHPKLLSIMFGMRFTNRHIHRMEKSKLWNVRYVLLMQVVVKALDWQGSKTKIEKLTRGWCTAAATSISLKARRTENCNCVFQSYKKTSFDQTTRRRDNETRRRDETTRRDNETTRRPNRGGPKSLPYFSNFGTPFFWTFSQPVQETTRQQDNETTRRWDDETTRRRDGPPEAIWSLCFFVGNHQVSLRLIVSLSRRITWVFWKPNSQLQMSF